ncbi:MAG: hypothetical protein QP798_13275 [Staphylococcus simulans]|uniref:hypothetical protein n=2 Tax=Staphylococcus TaxID=1279 RepID=UPI0007641D83|nr:MULTISPECIES: hypothetical protein [Staphylococcus]KXA44341.1 hypothetical protein HMPREF3215_01632 [Staphylococcus simulans]MDK7928236.1 hypothetical protein [Staphylococcus simulans]MDK8316894.1 hypothetical protein [Staphylococcus simulans]MDT4012538.1 hypothetical protein [Staphylococcus simulans]MDU7035984.1 hypothetical protein [Staphylococcus simulans]
MDRDYFIFKEIINGEDYKKVKANQKYILALMYSFMNVHDKLSINQNQIIHLANISRETFRQSKRILKKHKLIEYTYYSKVHLNIPVNQEKVSIHNALINGQYSHLSNGAKLFYSYFFNEQNNLNENYIKYTLTGIMNEFGGTYNTIENICQELIQEKLLVKKKDGVSYVYHFKEI